MNLLYAKEIYLSRQINFFSEKNLMEEGLNNEKEISHCANTK